MEEEHEKSSLRSFRRKKPSVGLSCCFNGVSGQNRRGGATTFDSDSNLSPGVGLPPILPSPNKTSSWTFKSGGRSPNEHLLPAASDQIKGKYRNFISRMSRHRRHFSADQFSYDPFSYARNFEDDDRISDDEDKLGSDHVHRDFISRLPASPPTTRTPSKSPSRKITQFDRHDFFAGETREGTGKKPDQESSITNHELRRGFEALSASMRRKSLDQAAAEEGKR